tara:strand:+ start:113 stop:538 length:426 start_codon:yes stop_codon:yes gene_type:complete
MSTEDIFLELLNNDMENMFKRIVKDFKDSVHENKKNEFTVENLSRVFKIDGIKRIREKKTIKVKEISSDNHRCMARIWGSTPPVAYYCHIKQKYIYGERCTRPKKGEGDYCGLHIKNLPHGIYGKLPPHEHFEKYLVTTDS